MGFYFEFGNITYKISENILNSDEIIDNIFF
jgi:hypothetical protein